MPAILILGANSDIAVAIARKFASKKYDIILAGRNMEPLNTCKQDLEIKYKVNVSTAAFDALNFDSHKNFYETLSVKPAITACIFGYLGKQEDAFENWEESEKVINTNYVGAVSILNIIAKDYVQHKNGTIIGVSSVAGERGRQSNFIYGSAKAAFSTYLSGLRNKMYQYNVHVLTVLPGFVYTKMTADLELPALLTANPQQVADAVWKGVTGKKNVIYVKWFWRWIMMIIKMLPENIFKKKKL